jgi:hypothetical protein
MFERQSERVEFVKVPQALEKANKILSQYRINTGDFLDLYGSEVIEKDLADLKKRKSDFSNGRLPEIHERVNKDLATIFEAMIFDQGESSEWFGENAFLISTSEYDDVINGVDVVVEWDQDSGVSRMAAGIDVTFNHDVQKKIHAIKKSILAGNLGVIKYFKSEVSKIRGEVSEVPRIILGADVDTVRELTNEWAVDNNKALSKHPVQFQFFDEAISQCRYFIDFAERNNQHRIAGAYSDLLRVLEFQYQKKKQSLGEDPQIRDAFYKDIQTFFQLEN